MNKKKVNVQMLEPQPTNGIMTIDTTSKPNYCQTQCTTLRELLEQMLKEEEQSAFATPSFSKMEKHYANADDIKNVIRLIKERQPVA